MDEDNCQDDAEDGAEHEADGRLAPGEERRVDQHGAERVRPSRVAGWKKAAETSQIGAGSSRSAARSESGPAAGPDRSPIATPRHAADALASSQTTETRPQHERDEERPDRRASTRQPRRPAGPRRSSFAGGSDDRGIGDLEGSIDDLEALRHLLLADRQRRVREERVPAHEGVQPVLAEALPERDHLVARCR